MTTAIKAENILNNKQTISLLDIKDNLSLSQDDVNNNKIDFTNKLSSRLDSFLLLKTLGVGEFGKVKLGKHIKTGQKVAVKLIKKESIGSTLKLEKIRIEIDILKTLNHPYIVKLFSVHETSTHIGMVLEYAQGGELFEYIYKQRYLKEEESKKLFSQLISCVHYMHQKKIVHRDLKLENILLDRSGNIIVTDFGFSRKFSEKPNDLMSTACGSPVYAAPELVMTGKLYSGTSVDVWSCGIILFAMLCGYLPFDDDLKNPQGSNISRLYRYIMTHQPRYPSHLSETSKDLIAHMLIPNPEKRYSIKEVIVHPWLSFYRDSISKSVDQIEKQSQTKKDRLLKGLESNNLSKDVDDDENYESDQDSSSILSSSISSSCSSPLSLHVTGGIPYQEPILLDSSTAPVIIESIPNEPSTPVRDEESICPSTSSSQKELSLKKLFDPSLINIIPPVAASTIDKPPISNNLDTSQIDVVPSLSTQKAKTNLSLKAKFLSSVKRHNSPSPKPTFSTEPVPSKERVAASKNKNSWQSRIQTTKERPSSSPIQIEPSKSERILSWIKKSKPNTPTKKIESIDFQPSKSVSNNLKEVLIPIVKPIEQKPTQNTSELRVHQGPMNRSALTSKDPISVLLEINKIMLILGIEVTNTGGYRLLCTRPSVSNKSLHTVYGHPQIDDGNEVVFSIEICRFENLSGLFSIDVNCISPSEGESSGYQFIGQKLCSILHLGGFIRNTNFNMMS